MLVGPADASIAKISDVYRKVIYMKAPEYATLVACKDLVERKIKKITAHFPMCLYSLILTQQVVFRR